MSGEGASLTKTGSGTLTITGQGTYTGGTIVQGGRLIVGTEDAPSGSLAGSVTVTGGMLSGHGTISGSVDNQGGTVRPGGSIGTLTVGGFSQGSAGTLEIEIAPAAASLLVVNGSAALAGTASIVFDPGTYSPAIYPIVTASDITGRFQRLTTAGMPPDLVATLNHSATETNLVLLERRGLGTVYAALPNDLIDTTQAIDTTLLDRLAHAGSLDALHEEGRTGPWVQPLGRVRAHAPDASGPAVNSLAGGVLFGHDWHLTDAVDAGAALGFTSNTLTVDGTGERATTSGYRAALYGDYRLDEHWRLGAVGSAVWSRTGFARPRQVLGGASAESYAREYNGSVMAEYAVAFTNVTLAPRVTLTVDRVHQNGLTEKGPNGLALTVGDDDTTALTGRAELQVRRTFGLGEQGQLTAEGRVGALYDALAPSNSIAASFAGLATDPFQVETARTHRAAAIFGTSLTGSLSQNSALFLDLEGQFRQKQSAATISAGIKIAF